MSEVRQALTGILAALISAVIVLGSIVLALSETGQKLTRLPESSAELSTPMPPPPTSKPGEPTYHRRPHPPPADRHLNRQLQLSAATGLGAQRSLSG